MTSPMLILPGPDAGAPKHGPHFPKPREFQPRPPCSPATVWAGAALVAGVLMFGAGSAARAQQSAHRPQAPSPCAALGQGFMQMPGTDTCVRIGGSVQVDAGRGNSSSGGGSSGPSASPSGSEQGNSDPWRQTR